MKKTLSFLKRLANNNNREWFNLHKDEYLEAKEKTDRLTADILLAMSEFEPEAARLSISDCTYRIYRDTRFSLDKTPYKNHIGLYFNPPFGKNSPRCGYYLHLEPGNCMIGAGAWWPESKILKNLRQSIFDNIEEYLEIIGNPEFKKIVRTVGFDPVKTCPKGFPKDWEHIDLIKPKSFVVEVPLTDDFITSPGLPERVAAIFKILKPFNDFLNFTIDEE